MTPSPALTLAAPPGRAALLTVATCFLLLTLSPLHAATQRPCDDGPCQLAGADGGEYHLAYPRRWDGRSALPVLVFFHGHGSNGAKVVRNGGLRRAFGDAGFLVVAPTGTAGQGRNARGWPARHGAYAGADARRNDIAFTHRVLDDVARQLPVDGSRIVVSGFSSGGSMAWYLACHGQPRPGGDVRRFAGFVAVAGGLRRPIPASDCPSGPMRMLHIHGFADTQVPLEGRAIRDWHQGDVFEGLGVARAGNACRSQPRRVETRGRYQCREWDRCGSGEPLSFCLHDGGHGLPRGWIGLALEWFGG